MPYLRKPKLTVKFLALLSVALAIIVLLALSVVGQKGDPIYFQKEKDMRVGGPFELSNSTSRYALTEAIVRNKTFFLDQDLAKFSSPDVVDYKGKFFSIFTPGVSFLGVPFYLVGQILGLPQLLTYLSGAFLALVNLFLIMKFAQKLGVNFYASLLSGFIFVFATNALAYSATFTQHHLTVTLILLSLLNVFAEKRTLAKNILLGLIFGAAALTDIPNLILMSPILIYVLIKHIQIKKIENKILTSFNLAVVGLIAGLIPLIFLFTWYNHETTGSYIRTGQTIGRTHYFRDNLPDYRPAEGYGPETENEKPLIKFPFNPRNELNGLYILLLSNERSWLYYSPVVLLGFLGISSLYKNRGTRKIGLFILGIVAINILLYSMFGDPWGGWAFGSRYLIPAAALLCVALGIVIQKLKKNLVFMLIFLVLLAYSIGISSLGALTTNAIPPKVEAVNLPYRIPYTYKYNLQFVQKNQSTSLLYNIFLSEYFTVKTFIILFSATALVTALIIYFPIIFGENDRIKLSNILKRKRNRK